MLMDNVFFGFKMAPSKLGPHPIIKTDNADTSWATMRELVGQADGQLLHWMYTLWV